MGFSRPKQSDCSHLGPEEIGGFFCIFCSVKFSGFNGMELKTGVNWSTKSLTTKYNNAFVRDALHKIKR